MIYTLTVSCVCGAYLREKCVRVIEMDENDSLYHLHEAIQDAVQFGRDHPFEFYAANSAFGRKKEWLTYAEAWEDEGMPQRVDELRACDLGQSRHRPEPRSRGVSPAGQ